MKVNISESVFADRTLPIHKLVALLGFGVDGRYSIFFETDTQSESWAWRQAQSKDLQEAWELAYQSTKTEALSPSRFSIQVEALAEDKWDQPVPSLSLDTAFHFLQKPFKILVENSISDAHFLLAVAQPESKSKLEKYRNLDWIAFEHGGGLGSMPARILAWNSEPGRRLKGFVLFDSDALIPGSCSNQAQIAREKCLAGNIDCLMLGRRMIENYLPKKAIEQWIHLSTISGLTSGERRKRAQAFFQLSDDQRFHFNFKVGFEGDRDRILNDGKNTEVALLFHSLSNDQRIALKNGLQHNIAELYPKGFLDYTWFISDGSSNELNNMVGAILKSL